LSNTKTIQPRVSIALCTYNGARYLPAQLDSILGQTWKNIEVIIVDDCSTDETKALIAIYGQKDNRIHFFENESNLGYNKNFEKAFSLCTGEFIAISDQDDIWELNKIERMINNWPEGSLFVYSLSGNFAGDNFETRTEAAKIRYAPVDDIHQLVFNSPVHGHACIFKKELLKQCLPFPADIYYDWWMSMHAASAGVIGCIPITLTWHRDHSQNSSRTLMTIKNRVERDHQLRRQMMHFIETFCHSTIAAPGQRQSLLRYAGMLKKMNGKKFSVEMFWYVMKNRRLVFHYKKKKPLLFFSQLKHALKMARRGLL
jgi:glycosyltransferase involved in cell wall biosynthesis